MTEIKRIKGGTDNCYLVTDGSKAILVDTASRQCLEQVIAECDKYEMKLIVLTAGPSRSDNPMLPSDRGRLSGG